MAFERLSIRAASPAAKAPVSKPPVTGGDLPPLSVNGTPDDRTKQQRSVDLRSYMQALAKQGKLSGTLGPLFALINYRTGATPGLTQGKAAGGNKPGGSKPPATPAPQWAFKPNPLDQPSYVVPMGNAAAYTINPPAQQWMFDPATYGQGAPPQWYGQPVVPNSQPPFRY